MGNESRVFQVTWKSRPPPRLGGNETKSDNSGFGEHGVLNVAIATAIISDNFKRLTFLDFKLEQTLLAKVGIMVVLLGLF